MEGSWHQLTNSVTLIFTVQTCITCSRPTSSVVQEMPLWPFPPLLLFSWCFSPQLCLVQPVLPHGNVLLQRLRTDTGNRLPPNTTPCSVVTGRPTTGLLQCFPC